MAMRCCQPGSNTADCRAVDPAVYGYASVVTSRPRSRAPRMSWRRSGVSRWPMLVTWTTCKEAPVAAAVGEDPGTLEEVYEPFLMQQGFLARTPRGRVATPAACARESPAASRTAPTTP